ncbi:PAS domain S-box protein [Labilibaculum sp. K2S]|uniref:PAS domain S-box protein n=1 Tax=Labilibaculum sp. K2S TaxID=3056386 RepID=UPI0025A43FF5|nr:PAS domain S-box protein [Labilibaculum sp. K2S]MDM8161835.1 PAS domain S-box protein [Labilibaculum sp. K2S]
MFDILSIPILDYSISEGIFVFENCLSCAEKIELQSVFKSFNDSKESLKERTDCENKIRNILKRYSAVFVRFYEEPKNTHIVILIPEAEIRTGEKKYIAPSIVQHIDLPLFVINNDDDIIFVNDALLKLYDCSDYDLLGKGIRQMNYSEMCFLFSKEFKMKRELPSFNIATFHIFRKEILLLVELEFFNLNSNTLVVVKELEVNKIDAKLELLTYASDENSEMVVITDIKGVVKYTNKAFREFTGYEMQAIIGEKISLIKSDYHLADVYKVLWNTILGGNVYNNLLCNKKKSGQLFWEDLKIVPIMNTHYQPLFFVKISHDTTSQIRNQDLMEESMYRYDCLFTNNPAIMLLISLKDNSILDANKKACEFYGYTKQELLKTELEELHVLKGEELVNSLSRTLESFSNNQFYQHKLKSGEIREVEVCPSAINLDKQLRVYLQVQDITARVKLGGKMMEMNEYFTFSQSLAHIGSWGLIPGRKEMFWSEECYKILGFEPYKVTSSIDNFIKLLAGSKRNEFKRYIRSKNGKENYLLECEILVNESEPRIINIIGKAIYDSDKKFSRIVGSVQDITQIKMMERKLLKSIEKTEEVAKLKSSFLALLSHELKTPLNSIIGFSSIISMDNKIKRSDINRYVDYIKESGEKLSKYLDEMVSMANIDSEAVRLNMREFSISDFLDELNEWARFEVEEKGLQFEVVKCSKCKTCSNSILRTDYRIFRKAVELLISNSLKFTHEGGITVGFSCDYSNLSLYVKDTGIGIRREQLEFIFDSFRQVEHYSTRQYEGLGLGLYMVKKFIDLLGGTVSVESEYNVGSVFKLSLPIVKNKLTEGEIFII